MTPKHLRDLKTLDFKSGDIVYWAAKAPFRSSEYPKYIVKFGRVDERYFGECRIDYLVPKERRKVGVAHKQGEVPIGEFVSETHWTKLPKGWTYNTKLYYVTEDEMPAELKAVNIKDPDSISMAYNNGLLVEKSRIFWGRIDAEITKNGYRVITTYPDYMQTPSRVTLNVYDLYKTYDEAQEEADAENAELIRQSNLTDYEWSVEQIANSLNHYCKLYGIGDYAKEKMFEYMMGLPEIEDIETRISMGQFEWRNWKKRKWNAVKSDW